MFQNTKQIIMKVTRGCNLSCKYCYLFDKEKYSDEEMSDEVFDFIIRRWFGETSCGNAIDTGSTSDKSGISLVLHGGEPLLIGKEKFTRFVKKAYQYAREYNKYLVISTQTNTTLIDDEWIQIFKIFGIQPGVSFDGIEKNIDYRSSSSNIVFQKILQMNAYGVCPGILMVLHKGNYMQIIDNFERLRAVGVSSVKVNRSVDVSKDSDTELTSDELMIAAEKMCSYMFASKGKFLEETLVDRMRLFLQSIDDKYHQVKNTEFDHCYSRFCGGMKNLMEIEPDGSFHFCGRISKRNEITSGGTVFDKDICELQESRRQWKFLRNRLTTIQRNRCNECPSQHICDGGCISFSFQKYDEPTVDPTTCAYFKKLHKYFIKNYSLINTLFEDGIKEGTISPYKESDKKKHDYEAKQN